MSMQTLANQIQIRRRLLKITQRDCAEISGVSLRTIKAIEKGEANPTVGILSRVIAPLGLVLAVVERIKHE